MTLGELSLFARADLLPLLTVQGFGKRELEVSVPTVNRCSELHPLKEKGCYHTKHLSREYKLDRPHALRVRLMISTDTHLRPANCSTILRFNVLSVLIRGIADDPHLFSLHARSDVPTIGREFSATYTVALPTRA